MSLFVQTIKKRGKIDEPSHWADGEITRRPVFNLSEFQKKIDKAIGKSKDGYSIIRCRWTWDEDCYNTYYKKWDAAGIPTEIEKRPRYKFTEVDLGNGDKFEICPPRFVLEELHTPEQMYEVWERTRWQFNKELGFKVQTKPPMPREGVYVFYKYIADHDAEIVVGKKPDGTDINYPACCYRALQAEKECFGIFRNPSQFDILRLKKVWQEIQRNRNRVNPYAELNEKDLAEIDKAIETRKREKEEKEQIQREQESRRFYEDLFSPRKEFSLPQAVEKTTPGGIILIN